MNTTTNTIEVKPEDFQPGENFPESARMKIVEHFLNYSEENGADLKTQMKPYTDAGAWIADCIAAWGKKYLEKTFSLPDREETTITPLTKQERTYKVGSFFDGMKKDVEGKTGRYASWTNTPYPPPKQGLLIYGEVGRGKTFLARRIYEFLNKTLDSKEAVFIYDTEFNLAVHSKGRDYVDQVFFGNEKKILFFDDIGNEEDSKLFGNTISGREIIRYRHICREKRGVPTVLTTNLNAKTLADRYDIYVESRVFSDYKGIFLDYPHDRRKAR